MRAFQILINRWELSLLLVFAFLIGAISGIVFLAINKEKGVKFGEKLDQMRIEFRTPLSKHFQLVKILWL